MLRLGELESQGLAVELLKSAVLAQGGKLGQAAVVLFVGRARGQTALPGLERLPGIAQVSSQVGDSERQLEALPCRVTVGTGSCLSVPVCHGMGSFRTQEASASS